MFSQISASEQESNILFLKDLVYFPTKTKNHGPTCCPRLYARLGSSLTQCFARPTFLSASSLFYSLPRCDCWPLFCFVWAPHTHTHTDAGRPQLSWLISWSITELPGICPDHTNSGNGVTGGYAHQTQAHRVQWVKGKDKLETTGSLSQTIEKNDLNVNTQKYTQNLMPRRLKFNPVLQFRDSAATVSEGAGGRSVS